MGRKPVVRKTIHDYTKSIKTLHLDTIHKATKAEASRQYTQMENWRKLQEQYDPDEMLDEYEETIFPLIDKARKYRSRIYERNKIIKDLRPRKGVAELQYNKTKDKKYFEEFHQHTADLTKAEDEQILYAWKIMRIYCHIVRDISRFVLVSDGDVTIQEYEYDPEME